MGRDGQGDGLSFAVQQLSCITLVGLLTTNYHRLSDLNRNLFSHSSGGWKSQIKVLVDSVPDQLFSWLADGCFLTEPSHGGEREFSLFIFL